MSYLFIKLQWQPNPVQTFLIYSDTVSGDITRKEIKIGDEIQIRVLNKGLCIGGEVEKGKYRSCIQNQMHSSEKSETYKTNPSVRNHRCLLCVRSDFFLCRSTCTGVICNPSSPRAKELCTPPNTAVYVTNIAGIDKVGVSLSVKRRWLEQGSDVATKIALLPGLEARAVEQEVNRALPVKLQVSSKKKRSNLKLENFNSDEFRKLVEEALSIAKGVQNEKHIQGKVFENPDIIYLEEYFGNLGEIPSYVQHFDLSPNKEAGGKIVAIKGALLIIKSGNYYYTLNTKELIGCEIEFINNAQVESQFSLDEWF